MPPTDTIPAGSANNTPLIPPVTQPDTLGTLLNTANTNNKNSQNALDTANTEYTNLLTQLSGQQGDYNTQLANSGYNTFNKELSDLNALQTQQTGQYLGDLNTIGSKAISQQGRSAGEVAVQRQHGIDALLTSSLIQAKSGQINQALATVKSAIDAKYEPIRAQLEAKKFVLDQLTTKAAEDRKLAIDLQMKQLEKQQNDENSIQSMYVNAAAQGAPQDILKLAQGAKTPLEAAKILGKYAGDTLKYELLKEQIKTEKSQRAKINAETSILGVSGGGKTTDTQIQNAGYADRIQQANNIIDANADTFKNMNYATFKLAGSTGQISNALLTDKQRQVAQAMRNFITAKLRKESGASISPTEFKDARLQYFPALGDDAQTLANKKALRDSVLNNLITGSGGAYKPTQSNNLFSQAIGIQNQTFSGTSILGNISSDGKLNFILPK